MIDTAFTIPEDKVGRMAALYAKKRDGSDFNVADPPAGSLWGKPPVFPSGAAGLVSTADDYQRFARMILGQGILDGERVLPRKLVEAMTTDALTPEQHRDPFAPFDRFDLDGSEAWTHRGFGYGLAPRTSRVGFGPSVGSVFWPGAFGTTWNADRQERLATTLLVQQVSMNPFYTRHDEAFTEAVYRAIDD
ncbi:MAG TPA: serine hydrolase domain-containing protein, partial [Polyangiaceae bacterium]